MKKKRFVEFMKKEGLEAAVFLTTDANKRDSNITYFTGLDIFDFCGLVFKGEKRFLIIRPHEREKAEQEANVKLISVFKSKDLFGFLRKKIGAVKRLGINKEIISVKEHALLRRAFPKTEFVDVSGVLRELREVKAEEEISCIKKACRYADKILEACVEQFDRFKRESDVMFFLEKETKNLGLATAFPPIVSSGKSTSMPHYETRNVKIKKGFFMIDFGVKYKTYCSDITRTYYVGRPTKNQRELYELLREAQQRAVKSVEPGTRASEVDRAARNCLGKHKKFFFHNTGHQLGVDIHENYSRLIGPKHDWLLREGVCFTIEPGIYFPSKFGIRIEDTVVVRKKGAEVLTKTPRELVLL